MRSKKKYPVAFFIIILIIVFVTANLVFYQKKEYAFTEDADFYSNPDRGIYVQVFTDKAEKLPEYGLLSGRDNLRMILLAYNIDGYQEEEYLDKDKVEELRDALKIAEREHFSVIFRAAYGFEKEYEEPENEKYILNHVLQMSDVLNEFTDTVVCIQAGMIGPYGEWHSTKYLENGFSKTAEAIVETWLQELPEEICIALRRPSYVRAAVEQGADATRLTVHNDALLANDTDMGTYEDSEGVREEELRYIESCNPVYVGGEMARVSEYTDPLMAISEFSIMNINYLNRYYNKEVWENWHGQSVEENPADEYIINHLGYRLVLKRVIYTTSLLGDKWEIDVDNVGFGKPDNRYDFYLCIRDDDMVKYYRLDDIEAEENHYHFVYKDNLKRGNHYQIGMKITRKDIDDCEEPDCIELANEEIQYKGGINYFLNTVGR